MRIQFPKGLLDLIDVLLRPLTTFPRPEERHNARIVAGVALLLLPLVGLAAITAYTASFGQLSPVITSLAYMEAGGVLAIMYILARTRWWRWSIGIGLILQCLIIFQQVEMKTQYGAEELANPLVWIAAMIAASSLFMPMRFTVGLTIFNLILIMLLPYLLPVLRPPDVHFSLFYVAAMSIFFTFIARVRQQDQKRFNAEHTALMGSEARYRTLFEASFEPLAIHEAGVIVDCNPAFLTTMGFDRADEVIGRHVLSFAPPEEHEKIRAQMAARSEGYETKAIRKDGRVIEVQTHSKNILYRDRPMRVVAFVDISERKRAEAERMRLELERQRGAMLRQFVSDASHDLKTPLTIMGTSVHLLRKIHQDPDKAPRYLDKISDQIRNMDKLLDDLFLMAKLDNPSYFAEQMPVNLNSLIQDVVETHRPAADEKHLALLVSLDTEPITIQGDERELHRALDRIIINAIQYTPQDGQVTLRLLRHENYAIIETTDSGMGITAEEMPLIFSRFYRADAARQTGKGGMGLGLPIARKIIEGHGGSIEVESQPGVGSTFRLCLPVESRVPTPV